MKKKITTVLALATICITSIVFPKNIKAASITLSDIPGLYTFPTEEQNISSQVILAVYNSHSTGGTLTYPFVIDVTDVTVKNRLVPVYYYLSNGTKLIEADKSVLQDNSLDSKDASFILALTRGNYNESSKEYDSSIWKNNGLPSIEVSLIEYYKSKNYKITTSDIEVQTNSSSEAIEGFSTRMYYYTISEQSGVLGDYNEIIELEKSLVEAEPALRNKAQTRSNVIAKVDGITYKLVIGTDSNFYLMGDKDLATNTKVIINYETNGGNPIESIEKNFTSTSDTSEKVVLATPTKEGSEFTGWYLDKKLKNEENLTTYQEIINNTTYKSLENENTYIVTVYAGWKSTVENPKTGIKNTIITSSIVTATALGAYLFLKKKNLFKNI